MSDQTNNELDKKVKFTSAFAASEQIDKIIEKVLPELRFKALLLVGERNAKCWYEHIHKRVIGHLIQREIKWGFHLNTKQKKNPTKPNPLNSEP